LLKLLSSMIGLVALLLLVHFFRPDLSEHGAVMTTMFVGFMLIGAWLAGELCDRIRLPKISGYLIFGAVVGPSAFSLVPKAYVQTHLQFASDLAIALIALTAGGEIRFDWLRGQLKRISIITGIELISVWVIVGVAVFILERYIPLIQDASLAQRIVIAMLTGLVAASNSPAVVIAMISEYRAHGPLANTTLAVTILKDMAMVVLFTSALALGKGVLAEDTALSPNFLLAVAVQLMGSLALGGLIGAAMAWYVDRIHAHLIIFVVGSCMLMALLGEQYFKIAGEKVHLEPLLLGLGAGVVMQNLWPRRSEPLFETIESMSLPVYCLFFALAGAKLDLGQLAAMWIGVVSIAVLRAAAVWGSVTVAARITGCDPQWRRGLWLGFIPQAGIALALATLIQKAFPDPASVQIENVLIGVIAINEIVGPVGFRYGLLSSGEAFQTSDKGKGGSH